MKLNLPKEWYTKRISEDGSEYFDACSPESRPGYTTPVNVVRVIDGDTVEVEVKRRFPVRLIHSDGLFNCPEKNTPEGQAVRLFVQDKLAGAKEVVLFIPSNDSDVLTDINSFNRILGEIFVDGESLSDLLYKLGFGEIT